MNASIISTRISLILPSDCTWQKKEEKSKSSSRIAHFFLQSSRKKDYRDAGDISRTRVVHNATRTCRRRRRRRRRRRANLPSATLLEPRL